MNLGLVYCLRWANRMVKGHVATRNSQLQLFQWWKCVIWINTIIILFHIRNGCMPSNWFIILHDQHRFHLLFDNKHIVAQIMSLNVPPIQIFKNRKIFYVSHIASYAVSTMYIYRCCHLQLLKLWLRQMLIVNFTICCF